MSRGMPSMIALLGLLAVAGYQNRGKIAEVLGGLKQEPGGGPGRNNQQGGQGGMLGNLGGLLSGARGRLWGATSSKAPQTPRLRGAITLRVKANWACTHVAGVWP